MGFKQAASCTTATGTSLKSTFSLKKAKVDLSKRIGNAKIFDKLFNIASMAMIVEESSCLP